jgi:hypothetical protein
LNLDQAASVPPSRTAAPAGDLAAHVAAAIRRARQVERPFLHLALERVLPEADYAAMLAAMPSVSDYRGMSGRSKSARRDDGTPTRVKIDLFPEYIRHLPRQKRQVWQRIGSALRSREVRDAFIERLAPALEHRYGPGYGKLSYYPIPILTRDTPGYSISVHPDTHWKAITVQLYLPPHDSWAHVGTVFHERLPSGEMKRVSQVRFGPNSGYAFAVGEDTFHSADKVGPEVTSRDSILLTYFHDSGALRILRNRGKRLGNFIGNELRQLTRR